MKQRHATFAGGFVLSVLTQAVIAQTAPPVQPAASAAAAATDDDATVQTVTVTANKREERLQDVPVSVSVVTGEQLQRQNIAQVVDLVRSAPSLNTAGPFGALSIRGIGSISFSRSSEGSVGVVVDNVALAGSSTNPPGLFDIARVEVLEGPQGTLFGRNSSAGVINIVTNAPDTTKFAASAHVDAGTRGDDMGQLMLNAPLGSSAALRVSGSYGHLPEQLHNLYDGSWTHDRLANGRARLLWNPSSDVTVNLIADETQTRNNGGAPWAIYESTPGSPLSTALAACGVKVGPENDDGCVNGGNESIITSAGVSGQVDVKLGGYTLSSVTSRRTVKNASPAYDVDSVPITLLNQTGPADNRNVSQEFKLVSPKSSQGDYVLGLYAFDGKYDGSVTQLGPLLTFAGVPYPLGQTLATTSVTRSYAMFGQGTYYVTPDLGLNLGARYGSEDVKAQTLGSLAPGAAAPIQSIAPVDGAVRDNYVSYRVGAQYDLSESEMTYVSYTKGYKGPAVNDQGGGGNAPLLVKPEIPHAAELGLKSTFLNGRLAANVALFYTKVDDFQAQFFDPVSATFIFGNAPSLTSRGFTIDLLGRPSHDLTLNAGLTYDDAKYGAGYIVACGQGQTAAQGCNPVLDASGNPAGTATDAGGNRLVGSPLWKATLSGEYVTPLFGQQGFVQADVVHSSRVNDSAAYDPDTSIAGSTIFGGRLGMRTNDGKYGLSVFARNLFDTYRAVARFAAPTAAQEGDNKAYAQMSGPESRRLIGVSLDARF